MATILKCKEFKDLCVFDISSPISFDDIIII